MHGQPQHARSSQRDRGPLTRVESLVQEQHAEYHVDQRIDEIAKTGFNDVACVDGPDVQAPVERDEDAADDQPAGDAGLGKHHAPPTIAMLEEQPRQHEYGGPDDAVGDDFHRRHRFQQVPIERKHAP